MTWIATMWATGRGKSLIVGVTALLLVAVVFLIGRCSKDDFEDDYRAQVEQTDRSTGAATQAAQAAIETLEGRVATEDAIDQVVSEAVKDVGAAASPDEVRTAVLTGVCTMPEYATDPACSTRAETKVIR